MRRIAGISILSILLGSFAIGQCTDSLLNQRLSAALQFASLQLEQTIGETGSVASFPRSTLPDGTWKMVRMRDWTSGFFPGCLWSIYQWNQNPLFRNAAERWTAGLDSVKYYAGSHDIGFITFCSFGNAYRFAPSGSTRNILLQAAGSLARRYRQRVGCIKSWDNRKWPYPVIIDNMMNLELLLWASRNGGTKEMEDIALSHARKTMENHFRPDGSTFHVISYDTTDGHVLARVTHQGYSDSSCWARGQAWAIYGFTMVHRYTREESFLRTAIRAADYFIDHLPADAVPYWDFQAAKIPNEPRDASAGAIAASALIELSAAVADQMLAAKYLSAAKNILWSLSVPPYLARGTASRGILNHATGHFPANTEVDVSLIYGDYYFLEACLRYLKRTSLVPDIKTIDQDRILKGAERWLPEPPVTVTAFQSPRSTGGLHDFFSEGDYWWPDPKNPDGPYIQRDGMTNPDNFTKHREVMLRCAEAVSTLTAAYTITGDERYAHRAVVHLKAWFVDPLTKMNPHLLYAQAIKGKVTGRGIGIIDTIHLIEIARSVEILHGSDALDPSAEAEIIDWFLLYLQWLITHQYGVDEREAKNNHGTWWIAQVATFAHLVGDTTTMNFCRDRFKSVLLPNQMTSDGSFPLELKRTKPYSYSLFNLDGMSVICKVLSTPMNNLWSYTLPDGRGMQRGISFIYPYIVEKARWPFPKDVMHFDAFPVRQPFLLFAAMAFNDEKLVRAWQALPADSPDTEAQRSIPIRQPVLWID